MRNFNIQSTQINNFRNLRILFFISLLIMLLSCSGNENKMKNTKQDKSNEKTLIQFTKNGELTFNSAAGDYISTINIEIADDDTKRSLGLMFRKSMAEDEGMLFIFPTEEYQSFWMRNTELSLDMIFVNAKNEIVTIIKNAEPFSEKSFPSTKPAKYVVEVNAGYTSNYGINLGDKIVWRSM
jgi:uncharacterized membrane protein (UPF0127 family)